MAHYYMILVKLKMSTRGVHKKCKKSSRSFFDRRKNDERKRHATESTLTLPVSSPFTISHLAEIPVNKQWRVFKRTESVDFCKLKEHSNGRHHVTINLTILKNLSWSVAYKGNKFLQCVMCLMSFPLLLTSSSQVKEMLTCLNQAVLCPGNPDDDLLPSVGREEEY